MNPRQIDLVVDLVYGLLIFAAIVLFLIVGTQVGIAFAIGVLLSYIVHVVWKMSRFDPDWMTREVAETVEKTVADSVDKEVADSVEKTVGETVEKTVGETVEKTVADSVEKTVADSVEKTVGETVEKTVGETVEKTVGETVDREVSETVEKTVSKEVEEVIEQLKSINERVDRRPRADEVEATVAAKTAQIEAKIEDSDQSNSADESESADASEPVGDDDTARNS